MPIRTQTHSHPAATSFKFLIWLPKTLLICALNLLLPCQTGNALSRLTKSSTSQSANTLLVKKHHLCHPQILKTSICLRGRILSLSVWSLRQRWLFSTTVLPQFQNQSRRQVAVGVTTSTDDSLKVSSCTAKTGVWSRSTLALALAAKFAPTLKSTFCASTSRTKTNLPTPTSRKGAPTCLQTSKISQQSSLSWKLTRLLLKFSSSSLFKLTAQISTCRCWLLNNALKSCLNNC